MRKLTALLSLLLLTSCPPWVQARDLIETSAVYETTDVAISATDDTVVATSEAIALGGAEVLICITCSGDMTTSANSTTYQTNINRGTTAAGTDVGTKVVETIKVTATGTEAFYRKACETRSALASVQYNCSVKMAGADGTTTVNESTITVEVLR